MDPVQEATKKALAVQAMVIDAKGEKVYIGDIERAVGVSNHFAANHLNFHHGTDRIEYCGFGRYRARL